jgi:hypothetical protein
VQHVAATRRAQPVTRDDALHLYGEEGIIFNSPGDGWRPPVNDGVGQRRVARTLFRTLFVRCGVGRSAPHHSWEMYYGARPLRFTVRGLLLALLVIVSTPADVAAAVGWNVTLS